MNITEALQIAQQEGVPTRRNSWKKDMFIFYTIANTVSKDYISKFTSLPDSVKLILKDKDMDIHFISSITLYMDGEMIHNWQPCIDDLEENDWDVMDAESLIQ